MWDGLKAAAGNMWNNPQVADFRNYNRAGAMWSVGIEPVRATGGASIPLNFVGPLQEGMVRGQQAGGTIWSGYNANFSVTPGEAVPNPLGGMGGSGWSKAGRMAMSGAGAAFSLWNIKSGYDEGGFWGAKDAAVWELATASAASRFAYGSLGSGGPSAGYSRLARLGQIGIKNAGTKIAFGGGSMAGGMARVAGAGLGATLGQAVLGTPGAFAGAYIGAAPMRFAATHPLLAAGMVAGAATAAVGYGTYSVVKGGLQAGYQHRQRQRGIDTSGSMAAFMTQGAMTMRQRAVQSIHKSHLNARSALGQEAGFMHMPSKNYHSRYR